MRKNINIHSLTAAFLTGIVSITGVKANLPIDAFDASERSESGVCGSFYGAMRSQSDDIKKAYRVADAAYNDQGLVGNKSRPTSKQVGFKAREELAAEGYQIVSFGAKLPGYGEVPFGIVTFRKDPITGRGELTIGYHGTECFADLLDDFDFFRETNAEIGLHGKVHHGFNQRYMHSRDALNDVIEGVLESNGLTRDTVDLTFTGHSMGAAITQIAAIDLANKGYTIAGVMPISSPRVFSPEAAEHAENLFGENLVQVRRMGDFIPMFPLGMGGLMYKHAGRVYELDTDAMAGMLDMMKNHDRKTILADASKEEKVPVKRYLGGKIAKTKEAVKAVASKLVSLPGRAYSAVKGFFRGKATPPVAQLGVESTSLVTNDGAKEKSILGRFGSWVSSRF